MNCILCRFKEVQCGGSRDVWLIHFFFSEQILSSLVLPLMAAEIPRKAKSGLYCTNCYLNNLTLALHLGVFCGNDLFKSGCGAVLMGGKSSSCVLFQGYHVLPGRPALWHAALCAQRWPVLPPQRGRQVRLGGCSQQGHFYKSFYIITGRTVYIKNYLSVLPQVGGIL